MQSTFVQGIVTFSLFCLVCGCGSTVTVDEAPTRSEVFGLLAKPKASECVIYDKLNGDPSYRLFWVDFVVTSGGSPGDPYYFPVAGSIYRQAVPAPDFSNCQDGDAIWEATFEEGATWKPGEPFEFDPARERIMFRAWVTCDSGACEEVSDANLQVTIHYRAADD